MASCNHCRAVDSHFGSAVAQRDLERYRTHGPNETTKLMIEGLAAGGVSGKTLLDVGAGIGVLHHELLDMSASCATHIEAAAAYIDGARQESQRRGHLDRVVFFHGDFLDIQSDINQADIVMMDRVICCYPTYRELVEAAGRKSRQFVSLSVPKNTWYVRLAMALENFGRLFKRDPFRTFVHPIDGIDGVLRRLGFSEVYMRTTVAWRISMYERK